MLMESLAQPCVSSMARTRRDLSAPAAVDNPTRCRDGLAHDQFDRNSNWTVLDRFAFDLSDQQTYAVATEFGRRMAHRGERWREQVYMQHVVEPDDGEIAWNLQPELARR